MALIQGLGHSIDRSRLISADDAYRVLELDRGASLHAIRRAWLRQILRHHPDKAGASAGDPDAVTSAASRTIRINIAYEMLQSDKIATRDRSQAEREAEYQAEMDEMEAELKNLDAKRAQREQKARAEFAARQQNRLSQLSMDVREAQQKHNHKAPPAVQLYFPCSTRTLFLRVRNLNNPSDVTSKLPYVIADGRSKLVYHPAKRGGTFGHVVPEPAPAEEAARIVWDHPQGPRGAWSLEMAISLDEGDDDLRPASAHELQQRCLFVLASKYVSDGH